MRITLCYSIRISYEITRKNFTSTKDALIYGWPSIRLRQTRLRSSILEENISFKMQTGIESEMDSFGV